MKNLYIISAVAATMALSACGGRKSNPINQGKKDEKQKGAQPVVSTEDARILAAIEAFKAEGYDPNQPANKALAEALAGAEMDFRLGSERNPKSEPEDPTPMQIKVSAIVGDSCEVISKLMYGNQFAGNHNKGKPADVTTPEGGKVQAGASYANLENKCIGGVGRDCSLVSVLLSKQDKNGGKPAQVAIAFQQNKLGVYELVGWPTSQKSAFKSVSEFVKSGKCWKKPAESEKKPAPAPKAN